MEKIASFCIDHNKLTEGIYVSRIDNDIITYDLRTRKPNNDEYMDNITMHSFEHMFATYARNSVLGENVIYFGPMGCRTGFYLLTADMDESEVKELLIECCKQALSLDEIPGNRREECGNYLEHDLEGAKAEIRAYTEILKDL